MAGYRIYVLEMLDISVASAGSFVNNGAASNAGSGASGGAAPAVKADWQSAVGQPAGWAEPEPRPTAATEGPSAPSRGWWQRCRRRNGRGGFRRDTRLWRQRVGNPDNGALRWTGQLFLLTPRRSGLLRAEPVVG